VFNDIVKKFLVTMHGDCIIIIIIIIIIDAHASNVLFYYI